MCQKSGYRVIAPSPHVSVFKKWGAPPSNPGPSGNLSLCLLSRYIQKCFLACYRGTFSKHSTYEINMLLSWGRVAGGGSSPCIFSPQAALVKVVLILSFKTAEMSPGVCWTLSSQLGSAGCPPGSATSALLCSPLSSLLCAPASVESPKGSATSALLCSLLCYPR